MPTPPNLRDIFCRHCRTFFRGTAFQFEHEDCPANKIEEEDLDEVEKIFKDLKEKE